MASLLYPFALPSLSALKWLPSELLDSFMHSAQGLLPSSQGSHWSSISVWISALWQVRFHLQKIHLHFGRWCPCDSAVLQPQRIRVQNILILALKTTEDILTQYYRQSSGRGNCCKAP